MHKRLMIMSIVAVLSYGLWISPDFTEIAAGVAIFLFGMSSLEQGFNAFTGGLLEKYLIKPLAHSARVFASALYQQR